MFGSYFSNPITDRNYYRQSESRSLTNSSTPDGLHDYFSANYAGGGVKVTETNSLGISAVYASVRVLAEALASLPFGVYEDANGDKKSATKHPVHKLIYSKPNERMTSFVFRETLMAHLLLWGNAYAEIIRGGNGRPVSFVVVKPWEVSITDYKDKLYYYINGRKKPVPAEDMIHIPGLGFDGIMGKSPVRIQAESLGIVLSAQRFGAKFFENGAHLGGVLEYPGKLNPDAVKNIRESWTFKHGGVDNVGATAILQEGMKYARIGIPPEEAQFIQTRQFGKSDVAGWYKVPPHMIGDLSHATFSNIEELNIWFVIHSLIPWLVRWEQEFNRKIFRESEQDRFYTKFNANALMRGNSAARAAYYETMQKNGNLNSNEVRELEELNSYQGGERYYIQGNNMVPVDMVDTYIMSRAKAPAASAEINTDSDGSGKENN